MKPSPRKSGERVTRSRGAALVELKSPPKVVRKTRSVKAKLEEKEMPEPQEDPVEVVSTPSTRTSKRKSVTGNTTEVPKSVERRVSRRTRSLAAATSVEDTIAEDAEAEPVEDKNSNESEVEEIIEPRTRRSKAKTSDSGDEQTVTRSTRRTRSLASTVAEVPELETIAEKTPRASKKSKVIEEETEVEETEKIEKRKTRRSRKTEEAGDVESASGIEDGEVESKTEEAASEPSVAENTSVETCVVAIEQMKSPKSKKSPKIAEVEENCVGAGNEENKVESKKSLDGSEAIKETNNNEESVLVETEKSAEKAESQEDSNLASVREVKEEEIVNFISSCRQETEKTMTPEEVIPEEAPKKAKTPKKTPKKQKDKLSPIDEGSVEESDKQESESKSDETVPAETEPSKTPKKTPKKQKDKLSPIEEGAVEESVNNESDLKKSEETVTEEAEPSKTPKKTPKKQKGKPSLVDETPVDVQESESTKLDEPVPEVAEPSKSPKKTPKKGKASAEEQVVVEVSEEPQVAEEKLPEAEVTKVEDAKDEAGDIVLRLEEDSEEVKISESPKKKKKSKTPKKNKPDVEELPNAEKTFEVSVFDTPASSPSEPKEEVPVVETPQEVVEPLETSGSTTIEAVDSTAEDKVEHSETTKSDEKTETPKKEKESLSTNEETVPLETESTKTPKKTPKKRKAKPAEEESVVESGESKPEEASPSKSAKITPEKQDTLTGDEGPVKEFVDNQEVEPTKTDETIPEETKPKKTPKKQKGKPSAEAEAPVEEQVDNQEPVTKEVEETKPEEIEPPKPKTPKKRKNQTPAEDDVPVTEIDQEAESKKSEETEPAVVELTKTPKKTPKKQKGKPSVEDEVPELVDNQEPVPKEVEETKPEEAEASKPKKTPKKRKAKTPADDDAGSVQEPESKTPEETEPAVVEPTKTPKKTPKKRKQKSSVEDVAIDAEASTQPTEMVTEATSEQVKDSQVFTQVKSPEAYVVDVKKVQNDADSDHPFQAISKSIFEGKSPIINWIRKLRSDPLYRMTSEENDKTSDAAHEKGEEENPIVIEEEHPIVIDDSEVDDEMKNLELIKLIKKLKKKRKILKSLVVGDNEKPKKKGKKEKIAEALDTKSVDVTIEHEEPVEKAVEVIEMKDANVENVEPVEEAVDAELKEETNLPTENVTKKKKKRSKKKKNQTAEIADATTTEKPTKREHEKTEEDEGSSSEKKPKLEAEPERKKTPGVIHSSSLPTSVDSIEVKNLFLEKDIKVLYLRKKNWKTEICIEDDKQIGAATSLLSEHYMGNSVRIEKYISHPKTDGIVDDDGLRFCQLYIDQIAPHVTESDLLALFPKATRCDLPKKKSGINKGFCHLTFPTKATAQEHLILNGKVNLAGYKLGIFARCKDKSKGVYGDLLRKMLVHVSDLDSVLIVEALPSNLHHFNLTKLFPSILHIDVKSENSKELGGAIVVCKDAEQAEEFLSQEILWNDKPLKVKKATRDLLYLAAKPVNESHKRPAAYVHSTLLVTELPDKTKDKEIEELFPSCVLINLVAKKRYALVGFSTRAEMQEISRTNSGDLQIRGKTVSVKSYDEPQTDLIESENDFCKLLHVRGFPKDTKRLELKSIFKNCRISMTSTDGVPYAVVKCKNARKAKEYFSKKNLVVGGKILKIRYLKSILKQMKKEAQLE